ncbi:hypothetical protein J6590_061566 [Homalodisca vitripennis]|nr:hypothetical protein J6590_061566 [Homalodisca vitripennis]
MRGRTYSELVEKIVEHLVKAMVCDGGRGSSEFSGNRIGPRTIPRGTPIILAGRIYLGGFYTECAHACGHARMWVAVMPYLNELTSLYYQRRRHSPPNHRLHDSVPYSCHH